MKTSFNYKGVFLFAVIFSFWALPSVNGQGYGDRNRVSGNGSFTIQGRILMPDGRPASSVKVSLNGADFTTGSTQTDNDGNFTFSNIPAGNYNVSVKGTNEYESENESLTISRDTTPGQMFNLAFHLRPLGMKKSSLNPTNNPLLANVPKDALKKHKNAAESAQKNDFKAAVAYLDEAIGIYPNFALAYNEKGIMLLKQNELDKALEAFSKAIQIKPDYLEAKVNFGYTLLNQKDYQKVEVVMRDVLQQKQDLPSAQMYLGIALIGLKKIDDAEASLKKAISLKGGENLAQAHRYLGGIYMQKKKNAEAIAELEKYLELSPKAADADKIKAMIGDLKKKGS